MRRDPIVEGFETLARRAGDAPLVVGPKRAATRADVLEAARALEREILDLAPARSTYALMACANGAGFLAALIGTRRAGLVPVLMDHAAPEAERARVVAALDIPISVTCADAFPDHVASFRLERFPQRRGFAPDGAGYVKLTSGSTGAPCGVAIAPEALASDDEQLADSMGLGPHDRFLAPIPWSHSYGLSSLVLPSLRRGSMLILPHDPGPWAPLDAARSLGATVFPTVPVYLQSVVALADAPGWPTTLATVISAGAPLLPETAAGFRERFGRSVHVFYGATECGGISYDREGGAALRGTVGTPVRGVCVSLDETVVVRSAACGLRHVPRGSDRLADGVFRTADVAAWTDGGELSLRGRCDALINAGGKKVQPREVEGVLRAMPGVRDAVVLGVKANGGEREIVRAVVACDPGALTYAAVTSWCRERLAAHKVPRSVLLLGEIPRTSRGKVDHEALARVGTPEDR
ncbi:MAG TPA: AMP-binding protein [Candidatus Polarisedimenticolaceae bacterium]|nr:AMP-binding protein [Candidatus Polarisedimenticolaceae bacterium]